MSRSRHFDRMRNAMDRGAKDHGIRIKGRPDEHERVAVNLSLEAYMHDPYEEDDEEEDLPEWERGLIAAGVLPAPCPPMTYYISDSHLRECESCCYTWALRFHQDEPDTYDPAPVTQPEIDHWIDATGTDYYTGREPRGDDDKGWMPVMTLAQVAQELGDGFSVESPRTHVGNSHAYLRAWEVAARFGMDYRTVLASLHAVGETAVTHPFHMVALPALERLDNL